MVSKSGPGRDVVVSVGNNYVFQPLPGLLGSGTGTGTPYLALPVPSTRVARGKATD
jgi:hypothetical protein